MGRRRGIIIQNDINSRYKYNALCFVLRICKYFNPFAGSNLSGDQKAVQCAEMHLQNSKFYEMKTAEKSLEFSAVYRAFNAMLVTSSM